MTAYGSSTVNRQRRTAAQLAAVDDAIVDAVLADSPVTLRGVYYRVVSAGAVEKTEDGYRLVGRELLKLRRAGRVSYADITDGTRWITRPRTWGHLDQMLEDAALSYRRALWHDQGVEVQVFTEKDAISGVILPVTERYDVPLGVARGYASESFAWSCAQSICDAPGTHVYVYQLGDHDPSGVDAWRDFTAKVTRFALERYSDVDEWLHFERLAVTEQQIAEWGLPTRPTKRTDTRAAGFTGESVEVDAISATTLRHLLEEAITQHIDPQALRVTRLAEASERETLAAMIGTHPEGGRHEQ
jgi:hypothetical protein